MLNNMVGKYYPINSKIHNMNILSKIICTIIYILMLFLTYNIYYNIVLGLILIFLLILSKIPLKTYFKMIYTLKWLLLFIIIINLIFKINITIITIALFRLIAIVLYTSILNFTTTQSDMIYGLQTLFSPLRIIKVPINRMAFSITLALRFIPTIIEQGKRILKSQASRGIDYYNSNFKTKLNSIKTLIIPIFVLTIKRADELADTLEIRMYNIDKKRLNLKSKWKIFDIILVVVHITLFILIVREMVL